MPQTLVFFADLCSTSPNQASPGIWASTEVRRAPLGGRSDGVDLNSNYGQ